MFLNKTPELAGSVVMWINTDHIEWAIEVGDGFELHMTGNASRIDITGIAADEFRSYMRCTDREWKLKESFSDH